MERNNRVTTYETARGYILEIMAVSPFTVQDVRASVKEPDKPTYEMPLASGGVQVREHDESTLQTAEDHAAWDDYLAKKKKADEDRTRAVSLCLIREGIVNLPLEPDEEWTIRYQRHGLKLPTDPDELFLKWFQSDVIGSVSDFTNLQVAIMRASGDVPEEVIDQIIDSFRGAMAGYGAKIAEDTRVALDSQPITGSSGDGAGVGLEQPGRLRPAPDSGSGSHDSREKGKREDGPVGTRAASRGEPAKE